jgi:hypothetical protein
LVQFESAHLAATVALIIQAFEGLLKHMRHLTEGAAWRDVDRRGLVSDEFGAQALGARLEPAVDVAAGAATGAAVGEVNSTWVSRESKYSSDNSAREML